MSLSRTVLVFFVAIPCALGASKEIIELQRDVAQLQDQVRTLQRALDEKVAALQTLSQQVLDAANRTDRNLAVMQSRFSDTIKQQQDAVGTPIANVGVKIDQMGEDFRAVREAVLDMNSRLGKLDAKIADLENAITTIKNPPPPPSTDTGAGQGAPLSGIPASSSPPPGMQADTTYTNAYKDYSSGQPDLALKEFSDYLRYFPNTALAGNAQFYQGMIYYNKKDYDNAIQAFDAVLERYTDNSKTPSAHYEKGKSLLALNKRDAAAREFRDIVSHYPDSDVAPKAKEELRNLGLASSAPAKKHR
jgi:tol-pal system protein YbgF